MAALGAQSIASSYEQLLHVDRDGGGNTTTHVSIKDGDNGTTFGFTIASDALMMTSTNRLEFGDTGTYIHQSADGVLDLVSDTEIEINATTIDMNGALDLSGNAQLSGTVTVGADGSGTDVIFYSGTAGDNFSWDASEEKLTITGTNGQTALDVADGNLVVADNVDIEGDIDVNGTSNLDNTDIDGTLAVDGTTISLDATTSFNIDNSNTSNGITIGTATSGVPISIGHTTSETTVNDNLVVTGDIDLEGSIDVNGTSNLDIVDIDGAVNMADTALVTGVLTTTAATVFNGGFAANASSTITTADNTDTLALVSTDTDANSGPNLALNRSATGADNDLLGAIDFEGKDDGGNAHLYARIQGKIGDASNGSEDGILFIETGVGGGTERRLDFLVTETVFNDGSQDLDFRVESDANASMIFVDSGYNHMGIGTDTDYSESILRIQDSENTAFSSSATDFQAGVGTTLQIGNTSDTDNSFSQIVLRHRSTSQSGARIVSATSAANTADLNLIVEDGNTMVKAIQIDPSGEVIMAKQPAFLARPSSAQNNFAVDSVTTVAFGTEVFDQGGNFASNTFTAPVTGKYQLNVNVRLQNIDSASDYYYVKILTSNRTYNTAIFDPDFGQDNAYWGVSISVLADMDTSDTASVQVYQASGTQQTDIDTESNFSGFLAC